MGQAEMARTKSRGGPKQLFDPALLIPWRPEANVQTLGRRDGAVQRSWQRRYSAELARTRRCMPAQSPMVDAPRLEESRGGCKGVPSSDVRRNSQAGSVINTFDSEFSKHTQTPLLREWSKSVQIAARPSKSRKRQAWDSPHQRTATALRLPARWTRT